ncbi:hypothetical protein [Wenxinia marina]|uniref:hypothetical protein n=1 Tax=Wenxinia marina TaxID=390641 RepID=UPI0012E082F6|nr:hypothetical protein [Wenxinia marina]
MTLTTGHARFTPLSERLRTTGLPIMPSTPLDLMPERRHRHPPARQASGGFPPRPWQIVARRFAPNGR